MNRLEQRREAFLLNKHHAAEAADRPLCGDGPGGDAWILQRRSAYVGEVVAGADGAEADRMPGMGLGEVSTIVIGDVPIDAVLLHVVGQQRLAEILIV